MTVDDVLNSFRSAASAVKASEVEFDPTTLGGLILGLTDRMLQIKEMEDSQRRVTPVIAGSGAERQLRGVN